MPLLLPVGLRWIERKCATDFGETAILTWYARKKIYKIRIFMFWGVARRSEKKRNRGEGGHGWHGEHGRRGLAAPRIGEQSSRGTGEISPQMGDLKSATADPRLKI